MDKYPAAESPHQHRCCPSCSPSSASSGCTRSFMILINSLQDRARHHHRTRLRAARPPRPLPAWTNYIYGITVDGLPLTSLWLQLDHHHLLRRADSALLLDVRMVHHPRGTASSPRRMYYLCVFSHGRAVPDGHVHPGQDGRYPQAEQPLQHLHHLPGLRRGSGGVHVHRLCEVHARSTLRKPP